MADRTSKVGGSISGRYYVDTTCISCEACTSTAPLHFRMKDDGSSSSVYKQPENESENEACEAAKNGCPVNAIGDDGDA